VTGLGSDFLDLAALGGALHGFAAIERVGLGLLFAVRLG
jgi:hypothetical protein